MEKLVVDRLPCAGPARRAYLEQRLERSFGAAQLGVLRVALELSADDHDGHRLVELTLTSVEGDDYRVLSRREGLPAALTAAFDAASLRLNQASWHPSPPLRPVTRMRNP